MKIAIVDDDAAERAALLSVVKEYAAMNRLELAADEFSSGEDLLAGFYPYAYSLIFLDIYLGSLTGIDTAKLIRERDDDVALVFLTSSEAHRPDAFTVFATDYLVKPCAPEAVIRTMDHILRRRTAQEQRLSFSFDRRDYSLRLTEIVSLEADGNYLIITDREKNSYRTRMTLQDAESRLDERFLRVIKGVIVNMAHVVQMGDGVCKMDTGAMLPMRGRSEKALRQQWLNYKFSQIRNS